MEAGGGIRGFNPHILLKMLQKSLKYPAHYIPEGDTQTQMIFTDAERFEFKIDALPVSTQPVM